MQSRATRRSNSKSGCRVRYQYHCSFLFSEVTDSLTDLFLAAPKKRWMQLSTSTNKTKNIKGIEPFTDCVGVRQDVLDAALEEIKLATTTTNGRRQYEDSPTSWNSWFQQLNIKGFTVQLDTFYTARYICLSTMASGKATHAVKDVHVGCTADGRSLQYGRLGFRSRSQAALKSRALEECMANSGYSFGSQIEREDAEGDDAHQRKDAAEGESVLDENKKRSGGGSRCGRR